MRWVAPSEKDTANQTLEKRLWVAADQFRANSGLKAQNSMPVRGSTSSRKPTRKGRPSMRCWRIGSARTTSTGSRPPQARPTIPVVHDPTWP